MIFTRTSTFWSSISKRKRPSCGDVCMSICRFARTFTRATNIGAICFGNDKISCITPSILNLIKNLSSNGSKWISEDPKEDACSKILSKMAIIGTASAMRDKSVAVLTPDTIDCFRLSSIILLNSSPIFFLYCFNACFKLDGVIK